MLARSRHYFQEQGICEVDCPALCQGAIVDTHIDLIPAYCEGSQKRYLHSSPESGMKRLLAAGMGPIFQLSHVFRSGELSSQHNPEFTLVEWYLLTASLETLIENTLGYIGLFLGDLPTQRISYRNALQTHAQIDYVTATSSSLHQALKERNIATHLTPESPKDDLLNIVLALLVEPHLGKEGLCVLTDYPASQAALAQTIWRDDEQVAERFEIYYQGRELANGYHELREIKEQELRFDQANEARQALGKEKLPPDFYFLDALAKGLPDCCGVAVGFDRLMMLRHGAQDIREVLPFSWSLA